MTANAAPPASERVIWFDVTEFVLLELRTGIQRVVRELLRYGVNGVAREPVIPVIAIGRRFHRLSELGWARLDARPPSADGDASASEGRLVRLLKVVTARTPTLRDVLARLRIRRMLRRRAQGLFERDPITMAAGDHLVLADSFWGEATTLEAAAAAKSAGVDIVLLCHDLIPLTHPHFCDGRLVRRFRARMNAAVRLSSRVIANSAFTASVFRDRFPAAAVVASPLGYDLPAEDSGRSVAAPAVWPSGLWAGPGRVFVVVGSIEPRKGHQTVLEAFERRWARGAPDMLLIIGKVGWRVGALMDRINHHPETGRRLFHVRDATDGMLATALQRADAAIVASFVEGFGLPLAESLVAGLPVIASDIPVFREIAEDAALYFAAGDPVALDAAIDAVHCRYDELKRRSAAFEWPDWREASRRFFALLEAPVSSRSKGQV